MARSITLILCIVWLIPAASSRAAEDMAVVPTDAGYRVTLEGQECVQFAAPELATCDPAGVDVTEIADGWRHVRVTWDVREQVAQDELSIRFDLAIDPDFWWAPHLAPEEGYVVAQHVFRAPALIAQRESLTLVIAPDLDAGVAGVEGEHQPPGLALAHPLLDLGQGQSLLRQRR